MHNQRSPLSRLAHKTGRHINSHKQSQPSVNSRLNRRIMPHHIPLKQLAITIISAHDLPPLAKTLRTFAVAYVNPHEKLTTKIDHSGHTNPNWNHNVAFHVDERFLKQESSFVTFEIYNLAWLRDLPIGTARLSLHSLSPPLHKNPAFRRISLQICRPSGHLQGTINIGVQLVDGGNNVCCDKIDEKKESGDRSRHGNTEEDDDGSGLGGYYKELGNDRGRIEPFVEREDMSPGPNVRNGPEPKTAISPCDSQFSYMRDILQTEIVRDVEEELYPKDRSEYGSSVFENWTEVCDENRVVRSKSVKWRTDGEILLKKSGSCRKRRADKKNGLFSCFFGNAYGFRFSFVCGSKGLKKTKKKKSRNVRPNNVHVMSVSEEDLQRFYV